METQQAPKKIFFFPDIDPSGGHNVAPRIKVVWGNLAGNPKIKTLQPERRERQFVTAR